MHTRRTGWRLQHSLLAWVITAPCRLPLRGYPPEVPPAPKPRPQASSELSPLLLFFKGTLLVTRGEGAHRAPCLEGSGI